MVPADMAELLRVSALKSFRGCQALLRLFIEVCCSIARHRCATTATSQTSGLLRFPCAKGVTRPLTECMAGFVRDLVPSSVSSHASYIVTGHKDKESRCEWHDSWLSLSARCVLKDVH